MQKETIGRGACRSTMCLIFNLISNVSNRTAGSCLSQTNLKCSFKHLINSLRTQCWLDQKAEVKEMRQTRKKYKIDALITYASQLIDTYIYI